MCLAIPGKIVSIENAESLMDRMGKIDFGGIIKEANLAYVPEAKVGQYVIIHVGFAISIVDEEEAKTIFRYLEEINELDELKENSNEPK